MLNSTSNDIEKLLGMAQELECTVMRNEPLDRHTTFRIGGPCTAMINIRSTEALSRLSSVAGQLGIRHMPMGKGSNLLFDDQGYDGVIFLLDSDMDGIKLKGERVISAQAGCSLLKLCRFALEHSLTGLEFAYGIPGSVGGAVYMNAGAYEGEIKNVLTSCTAVDREGVVRQYDGAVLEMGYRRSRFTGSGEIVMEGEFTLDRGSYDEIQDKMFDLMTRRRTKQPLNYPSAGSMFKRPEGCFAGQLIEESGLKGRTVGGAQVSEKHCGFVINIGGATCKDVLELVEMIRKTVYDRTGVALECEVKYIPFRENG